MKLLDEFFELENKIYEYFGYIDGYRKFSLNDCRDMYWAIDSVSEKVGYSPKSLTPEIMEEGKEYYEEELYYTRHRPRSIYRGKEYTMIILDTNTDFNIFLSIFSNDKEMDWPRRSI